MSATAEKKIRRRTVVVSSLFALWLAAIGARAAYLQVWKGSWLSRKAAVQYEKQVTAQGKRGTVYDRRHQVMAVSLKATSIGVYPSAVTDPDRTAAALAKALKLNRGKLRTKLAGKRSFTWIKRQATPKQVAAVRQLSLPGIDFIPEHSRAYPNTTLAAQVVGFTGTDGHGLEGLEFYYDRQLKGGDRTVKVMKDALGRGFDAENPVAGQQVGHNLVLTIDRNIQYIAEQALANAVTTHKGKSGMAVVMAPSTGEVLAMANYPFFNPNSFRRYQRSDWRNRTITDPFEPGSTLKIFSAAAALETGQATPSTIYYCENGTYRIGRHTIHDTKAHGWLSLQQIVKYSSNIGAVKVAETIGPAPLYGYLRDFGFGRRTGIDCPGESPGSLSAYQRWSAMDTAAIAFGQGISTTALQLVSAASAIANDGVLMQPFMVRAITDANGRPVKTFKPQPVRRVVSAVTARTVRRIMRTVITDGGTGVNAALKGYTVSGKTGTAQKIDSSGGYAKDRYVASFIGFAPADRPELVVLVVVDEPADAYYGGVVAAPAFKQIVHETLTYMGIAPNGVPKLRVSRQTGANG